MDITIKTTGMLIDELFTTKMKIIANPTQENALRASLLEEAIAERVGCRMYMIADLCRSLQDILKECWDAQETVSTSDNVYEVYHAARAAQQTNALRNKLIRTIDGVLGEMYTTALEKTYGE